MTELAGHKPGKEVMQVQNVEIIKVGKIVLPKSNNS